jgi:hypothetical protein
MKRSTSTLLIIFGIVAIGAAIYVYTQMESGEDRTEIPENLSRYFEETIVAQAVEGFDATLLMQAFPGLESSDFNEVETLEGRYRYQEGSLRFIRDASSPVTSAERTISAEGYATLLGNVASRLGESITEETEIDTLIETIGTQRTIETRIDQGASMLGIKLIPLAAPEDSRCPIDVRCIQAGTVRVRTLVVYEGAPDTEEIITLNEPIVRFDRTITLTKVEPGPESTTKIALSDYRFYFTVEMTP